MYRFGWAMLAGCAGGDPTADLDTEFDDVVAVPKSGDPCADAADVLGYVDWLGRLAEGYATYAPDHEATEEANTDLSWAMAYLGASVTLFDYGSAEDEELAGPTLQAAAHYAYAASWFFEEASEGYLDAFDASGGNIYLGVAYSITGAAGEQSHAARSAIDECHALTVL